MIMRCNRNKVQITDDEVNICLKALITLRNQLLQDGRYTDAVDDLILKLAK